MTKKSQSLFCQSLLLAQSKFAALLQGHPDFGGPQLLQQRQARILRPPEALGEEAQSANGPITPAVITLLSVLFCPLFFQQTFVKYTCTYVIRLSQSDATFYCDFFFFNYRIIAFHQFMWMALTVIHIFLQIYHS